MYPNHRLNVQITERYLLSATPSNASTAKYARPGELFGRIELNSELSDDFVWELFDKIELKIIGKRYPKN